MKIHRQMSESVQLGIVLALSGGFMDAYTYLCRGQVFANAQTGNILLFGVRLSEGDWMAALQYFCPVAVFALGIFISDAIRYKYKERTSIHWRQITILTEALILLLVSMVPQSLNLLANSLVSFACGIQVESFRKINGNGLATTMCIGNLRCATQAFFQYRHDGDEKLKFKGCLYYSAIVIFAFGAVLGNFTVKLWAEKAILVSSVLMCGGFVMMFIKEDMEDNPSVAEDMAKVKSHIDGIRQELSKEIDLNRK